MSSPGKLVKQQHISYWKKSEKVPAEYVLSIERETGVSRHELRPDLYPKEHQYSPHDSSLATECEAVPMRKAG
ncbi:helix-turn-helix domain-containing protein [Laribacter hongkongensis]|uniref:transcriptional regulator n=1 Tax=Laribacter hongkongensis TaxID=168471 RepID=UPI001EFD1C2C|nr:YdaS family helix-turn-helix protein [Laribacter hongkongensis]MCG9054743.1 helix-turn-helix domain-containing protein [Laribacter hongkongensis]